jgi:uncharacterized protein (DUF4415 family)
VGKIYICSCRNIVLQFCTYNLMVMLGQMQNKKRTAKSAKNERRIVRSTSAARRKTGRRKGLNSQPSAAESKRRTVSIGEVPEYYKPLKKPVTLRLDADVVAWFKRDGRRYQTRINAALRRVMEREMKAAGE